MAFGKKESLNYNISTFPVPSHWIFEKLLNLSEPLLGQSVSIHSIFNAADTNPSMIIYYSSDIDQYKFKDFSSGLRGDCIDFIQCLYDITDKQEAFRKALLLYQNDEDYDVQDRVITKIEKQIKSFTIRKWNVNDQRYWTDYHITSKDLEQYNIKPLSSYTFEIKQGDSVSEKTFENTHCYGYFKNDGTLYKIYNPKNKVAKFVKVKNYIQGHEQLSFSKPWLMIVSSMKDLISFNKLGFKYIECIAPDSENVTLTEKQIGYYKKRYKLVTVMFDNDVAGKKEALKYKTMYGLDSVPFEIEKDTADCLKEHGISNTKMFINPLLTKILNAYKSNKKAS